MKLTFKYDWEIGVKINGGGFGQVYEAKGPVAERAVVKLVPKAPGAERELLFVDIAGVENIVPIIDQGETEDYWALVMPRAEKSLRQHLQEENGSLNLADTVVVLSDITSALVDLEGRIVHRDLKPENILLLNGHWCLADFGISRYAEATTAPNTRKYALTPHYSAPERWRSERATSAADIYSLGIMAYELISGFRPFNGPALEDFREQHLHHDPPSLKNVPPAFAALVDECLYKSPEARPSPANVAARLARVAEAPSSVGLARLQEANQAMVAQRGIAARRVSEQMSESERREGLNETALRALNQISTALKDDIRQAAPLAEFSTSLDIGWTSRLNQAELKFGPPSKMQSTSWESWSSPAFTVISYTTIGIHIPANQHGYRGRTHALWYCDAQEAGKFQWFETAFMVIAFARETRDVYPFALHPNRDAAEAIGHGIARTQVAWPFTPIILGELDSFISRWAAWFADAALGQLQEPSSMPEHSPEGSWRQV